MWKYTPILHVELGWIKLLFVEKECRMCLSDEFTGHMQSLCPWKEPETSGDGNDEYLDHPCQTQYSEASPAPLHNDGDLTAP